MHDGRRGEEADGGGRVAGGSGARVAGLQVVCRIGLRWG